jgi:creatinine amidohydrolase/Fe(II)-dependent formamide hydrolase-like protein
MTRLRPFVLALLSAICLTLSRAPALATAQLPTPKPPDTVFLEELTWDELALLIKNGKTTAIIPTAGTEQKGPHMVIGEHKYAVTYTSDRIARALGNAIVAPVVTYVPEGSYAPPSGHMTKAGSITLPEERFQNLLELIARSLRGSGFTDIVLIGDSGGNQSGMRVVATKLNAEWKGTGVRLHFIGDYYTKAQADQRKWLVDSAGIAANTIGSHAGIMDTSELMYIDATMLRPDKFAPGTPASGVSGDPTKSSKEIGKRLLEIKVADALAQIHASLAAPPSPER